MTLTQAAALFVPIVIILLAAFTAIFWRLAFHRPDGEDVGLALMEDETEDAPEPFALTDAVKGADKRRVEDRTVWGRRGETADLSPLIALTSALHDLAPAESPDPVAATYELLAELRANGASMEQINEALDVVVALRKERVA